MNPKTGSDREKAVKDYSLKFSETEFGKDMNYMITALDQTRAELASEREANRILADAIQVLQHSEEVKWVLKKYFEEALKAAAEVRAGE